jgi:hypothetical protein
MDPVTETRPRVRPVIRRGTSVIGGLLALLLIHTVWDYNEARWLKAAMTTWVPDYGTASPPKPVPPDRDAAPYYAAAAVLAVRPGEHIAGFDTSSRERWTGGEVPPELLERIGGVLTSRVDALYLIDQATVREFGGFRSNATVNLFDLVLAKRLTSMRALHAATHGDAALATRSLVAELKMEGAERSPITDLSLRTWLLSWRSATVQDVQFVLSHVAPDASSLDQLSLAIAAADDDTQLTRFFLLAREGWIDSYMRRIGRIDESFGSAGMLGDGGSGLTLYRRIFRPLLARDLRRKLEGYARILEAAKTPWPDRLDRIVAATTPAGTLNQRLASLAGYPGDPGWIEDAESWWRLQHLRIAAADLAGIRTARVAVAIERYRRAHAGDLPATLNELTPAVLPVIPVDPFSGKPVRFVRDATSYTVYSVGPNGADDGGDQAGTRIAINSATRGPEPRMTGDIGVRIRMSSPK